MSKWKLVPVKLTEEMQRAAEGVDVPTRSFFECPHATIRSECYSGDPACEDGEENNHNCADAIWRQVLDDGDSVGVYRALLGSAPAPTDDNTLVDDIGTTILTALKEMRFTGVGDHWETECRYIARAVLAKLEARSNG